MPETIEPRPLPPLAANVLAARGLPARSRRLRRHAADFGPALREQFRQLALDQLRSDPREAAERARLALIVADACVDSEGRPDDVGRDACISAFAQAAITQGEHRAALRALKGARSSQGRDPAEPLAAELDTLRAQALTHLERYDEAGQAAERALQSHEKRGNQGGIIWATLTLADLAYRQDRARDALSHFARADSLIGDGERPRLRAVIATNRANALEACNRFHAAARQFERARELFVAERCNHSVAQVDYNAAYADALRGRYDAALRLYARAATEFQELADERHLAHIELDRAEIHVLVNMPDAAERHAADAGRRFRRLGLRKEQAQAVQLQARAAHAGGRMEIADRAYARAARLFERLGLTERVFQCLIQRAQLARQSGRKRLVKSLLAKADAARLAVCVNPISAATVDLLRGWLAVDEGDSLTALALAAQALAACRRTYAPCLRIEAHRIQGHAHCLRGDRSAAIDAYTSAIEQLERYRGGVPPDEYMSAFLAGRVEVYEEIVALLVASGLPEAAFEFAERAKSRALVDLLAGREKATAARTGDQALANRVQALRERLTAVYGRLFRTSTEPGARNARATRMALRTVRALEEEMADAIREQRIRDPEAASLDAVGVPSLKQIRAGLEDDATVLEFYIAGSTLYTFVVSREAIHVDQRELEERQLRFLLEQFHFHLAKHERPTVTAPDLVMRATRATLGKLAAMTVDPVREHLVGRRLVIVPHGVLHHLPFHALPWDDGWLSERFEVVYAPSASVYDFCRSHTERATGDPSIFGLPDEAAPEIEAEARDVAAQLGTERLYLNGEATFERLAAEAQTARIVHIATHGMFRHRQPMLSAIRLADRWANLYDLYELDVRSELVVLSTCESGTADVTAGDEILGLTRGFLYAGARVLLTTQWRVDDVVTTKFMGRFYAELETLGNAAAAHRAAMAAIRAEHPHPYYWAPFFLTGRPTSSSRVESSPTGQGVNPVGRLCKARRLVASERN